MGTDGRALPDGELGGGVPGQPVPPLPPPPPVAAPEVQQPGRPEPQNGLTAAQKEGIRREVEEEPQKVVLRVEVATKMQARLLTWSVIVLNALFIILAIVLLSTQGSMFKTLDDFHSFYKAQLILGCICLGVECLILLWLGTSVRGARKEGRAWSRRQRYFVATSAVFLGIAVVYSATFVAALAATLAEPDCGYPWTAMAALELVRRLALSFLIFFLLLRLSNMRLWRGPQALDADPNHMLLVDRPLSDKFKSHLLILCLWLIMCAFIAVNFAGRIKQSRSGSRAPIAGCSTSLSQGHCKVSALQATGTAIAFAANLLVVIIYGLVLRRALKDHKQLPFCRYRATNIFIRAQARVVAPVQLAILLTILLLELVPALRGSCMSEVSSQMGDLPVTLSLAAASTIFAVLYMPKARELDSPLLLELLQDFSWTQEEVPSALERRNQRLLASEAAPASKPAKEARRGAIDYLPGKMRQAMGMMGQVQDTSAALEQLSREPIFCMETAVRLYHWGRLAYRDPAGSDKYVNAATALPLFDLEHWEKIEDTDTDTHCIIGWSDSCAVLCFRGTSSMENTMTDLKSWRVRYTPEPAWKGRSVGTHAGFLKAWTHAGFNEKVLARLKAAEQGRPAGSPPLRIWVTGHSLGGALAVLASQQISRAHPASRQTVYTFGCPRVGNAAFAAMYNEAITDAWAIVNRGDPVTMIPKLGFKRIGQRVNIDVEGNLIVRGSYFELSVVHRGTVVKNHMMGQYGLALASIIKAQFSASKSLPGGAKGAEALLAALDIGAALVMSHMGLEALRDPALAPELTEKRDAQLAAAASKGSVTAGKVKGRGRKGSGGKADFDELDMSVKADGAA
ncbi:hypothetical protein ABPG75_007866 [Micractinium tetrahymenae]